MRLLAFMLAMILAMPASAAEVWPGRSARLAESERPLWSLSGQMPPPVQMTFMRLMQPCRYRSYDATIDHDAAMALATERNAAIQRMPLEIEGWIGRIIGLHTRPNGQVSLAIRPPDGTVLSHRADATLTRDSPLLGQLQQRRGNHPIRFHAIRLSGVLIQQGAVHALAEPVIVIRLLGLATDNAAPGGQPAAE